MAAGPHALRAQVEENTAEVGAMTTEACDQAAFTEADSASRYGSPSCRQAKLPPISFAKFSLTRRTPRGTLIAKIN